MDFEIIKGADFGEMPKRGRPVGPEAERKAAVIEKGFVALVAEDYMGAAANIQDEYYGERSCDKLNVEQRYSQQKHVAKLIRKRAMSQI